MRRQPAPLPPSRCLSARGGCPRPPRPLRCPADVVAEPLAQFRTHARAEVGRVVAVRGPVVVGQGDCTLLWCGNHCCNRCGRFLQLGLTPAGSSYRDARAVTIALAGPAATCHGDESLQCCPIDAVGEELIARGPFRVSGVTQLIDPAELCAPEMTTR